MKNAFLLLFFSIIASSSSAQENQITDSLPCPSLEVEGPFNDKISVGQQLDLSVRRFKKKYEKSHTLTYQWELSNGIVVGDECGVQTKALIGGDPIVFSFVHRETPWEKPKGKNSLKDCAF